ncbi:ras GEF, partial [Backusella circina FSU 941]
MDIRKNTQNNNSKQILYIQNQQLPELKTRLNRVRNIHMSATTVPTILQFQPVLIAYQLTLMDSRIIKNISVDALLAHSPKRPHPSITVSTDFFNYLTRLIEHSILLHQDASGRAQLINQWIKVAGKCHELKNYQTLKAVISALGTPPIQRLKRSWAFVPKKSLVLLEDLTELMSESCNYGKYRELLGIGNDEQLRKWPALKKNSLVLLNEPTVPFLGTFLLDMTYLVALQQQEQANKDDPRLLELLQLFKTYQHCPPYSTSLTQGCLKELNKHRKRKLSHALTRSSPMKKTPLFFNEDDTAELSAEMQQCLVTQYLLTRSWVSEKTVDELSLVREPPKT